MKLFLIVMIAVLFSTVIGTVGGLLIRRIPHRFNDMILGGASGVMLGAAILGLINPAAALPGKWSLTLTIFGTVSGALLISIMDKLTPHLHRLAGIDGERHSAGHQAVSRVLLFVTAIAIHKFPEGLAAGVSFGTENVGDVLMVAGGISLQNVPEAMVIASPLLSIGVSARRTVGIAMGIGLISALGTLTGRLLVFWFAGILPFILAFAGGTMLYVISDEMIPETHSHGYEKQATFALIAGFLLILIFQKLLGV